MKLNPLTVTFWGIVTLCAAACEDTLRNRVARNEEDQALWLRNVLAAEVRIRERGQAAVPKVTQFLGQVASVPGVEQSAIVDSLPGAPLAQQIRIMPEGYPDWPVSFLHVVSPGYFEVMELTLLRGRYFSQKDVDSSLPVAIVNQFYAENIGNEPGQYILREDTVGGRAKIDGSPVTLTIIGVVQNSGLHYQTSPEVYIPYTQYASYGLLPYRGSNYRRLGEPTWYLLARVTKDRKAVAARLQNVRGLEFPTLEEQLKAHMKVYGWD